MQMKVSARSKAITQRGAFVIAHTYSSWEHGISPYRSFVVYIQYCCCGWLFILFVQHLISAFNLDASVAAGETSHRRLHQSLDKQQQQQQQRQRVTARQTASCGNWCIYSGEQVRTSRHTTQTHTNIVLYPSRLAAAGRRTYATPALTGNTWRRRAEVPTLPGPPNDEASDVAGTTDKVDLVALTAGVAMRTIHE